MCSSLARICNKVTALSLPYKLVKPFRSPFESLRTNGGDVGTDWDFSVHAEPVEAFLICCTYLLIARIPGVILDGVIPKQLSLHTLGKVPSHNRLDRIRE